MAHQVMVYWRSYQTEIILRPHPAERTLTSDYSTSSFILVYDNFSKFSHNVLSPTLLYLGLPWLTGALVFSIQGVTTVIVVFVHALGPIGRSTQCVRGAIPYCQGLLLCSYFSPLRGTHGRKGLRHSKDTLAVEQIYYQRGAIPSPTI